MIITYHARIFIPGRDMNLRGDSIMFVVHGEGTDGKEALKDARRQARKVLSNLDYKLTLDGGVEQPPLSEPPPHD